MISLYKHATDWAEFNKIDNPGAYAAWYVAQGFTSDDDLFVSHTDRYRDFEADRKAGLRLAVVTSERSSLETIQRYLPSNYEATEEGGVIVIHGHDSHGWTMDGYVLPRLASGLHYAREV